MIAPQLPKFTHGFISAVCLLGLIISSVFCHAQEQRNLFFNSFENVIRLDFSTDPPTPFPTGISGSYEGIAHYEDGNGNILFWFNATGVYDANSDFMGGDHLFNLSIVYGILLLPSIFFAFFSAVLFDAPGSKKNPFTITMAVGLICFPIALIIALCSWIFYYFDSLLVIPYLLKLPAIPFVVLVAGLLGVIIFNKGSFSGRG